MTSPSSPYYYISEFYNAKGFQQGLLTDACFKCHSEVDYDIIQSCYIDANEESLTITTQTYSSNDCSGDPLEVGEDHVNPNPGNVNGDFDSNCVSGGVVYSYYAGIDEFPFSRGMSTLEFDDDSYDCNKNPVVRVL